ncbi:hypothetical protein G7Y89_g1031 [Cudoniella acicularis]|uniref:Methyltransferase domain-containing protein n=1 Tax=Cudoniella acicularis TaxID=354080 RepID=A0A8H4W7C5_9HELO|nr:hypothetical protein G7Y89_g1031 [Cudoniella acicularis]
MNDQDGAPMFAFQDLDYIPFGFSTSTAPYIETSAGTMRAAATLMHLGISADAEIPSLHQDAARTVVCDLGCGDGDFLVGLLRHINTGNGTTTANGVGVDYNADLIKDAGIKSQVGGVDVQWLIYDFNNDQDDLVSQLIISHFVTHVFVYLTPKQLALQTNKLKKRVTF